MILQTAKVRTPIGVVVLHAGEAGLCALDFEDSCSRLGRWLERRFGALTLEEARDPAGAVTALTAYFDGEVHALDALAADTGGTPFQRRVWEALRTIPPGATWSYTDLARAVGAPRAVRAVGAANGGNPVSLVVPCHRVIAADGTLGGYGGGLERKRWLLTHEAAAVRAALPRAAAQEAIFQAPEPTGALAAADSLGSATVLTAPHSPEAARRARRDPAPRPASCAGS